MQVADGPWYVDLGIIAAAIMSLATIWRLVVGPVIHGVWAAVRAAPQITVALEELCIILQGDVLGKLDEIQAAFTAHVSEAEARDERLDSHAALLKDHGVRLVKLEQGDGGRK